MKSPLEHRSWSCCCVQKKATLLFEGSRAPIFAKKMAHTIIDRMMKRLHWAYTKRKAHKCEKCLFAFSARQPFFCFLESMWLPLFTESDKSVFYLLHYIDYMVHVTTQSMESRKKHGPSFTCHRRQHGYPVAMAGHQCGPCESQKKRKSFNSFRSFQIAFLLNDFEGLKNTI